jgi:predicted ester cyclase
MSDEDYKALTLRLYQTISEVFRSGDTNLLDPLLAPDMVDHSSADGPVVGREPGKAIIRDFGRAFPDLTCSVDLMVAEEDRVAAFVTYTGINTGPFLDHEPTERSIRVTGMDIMRYRNGQVIELWSVFDDLRVYRLLGLVAL